MSCLLKSHFFFFKHDKVNENKVSKADPSKAVYNND